MIVGLIRDTHIHKSLEIPITVHKDVRVQNSNSIQLVVLFRFRETKGAVKTAQMKYVLQIMFRNSLLSI